MKMVEDASDADFSQIGQALEDLRIRSDHLAAIHPISMLAHASKVDSDVRQSLGDPQLIHRLVEIIECSVNDSIELTSVALRCLGNACIDNNAVRQTLTNAGFSWASVCFNQTDKALKVLTGKVLHNVCIEFEPAQQECYQTHLHFDLLRLCSSLAPDETEGRAIITDLLLWIVMQKSNDQKGTGEAVALPEEVLRDVIRLPSAYCSTADIDDFATAVEIVLVFLRDPEIQKQIVEAQLVPDVWKIMEDLGRRVVDETPCRRPEEVEGAELLSSLGSAVTWCLSDIAALPSFSSHYGLQHEWIKTLIGFIGLVDWHDPKYLTRVGSRDDGRTDAWPETPKAMTTTACQVIGNLLWALPPESYVHLVDEPRTKSSGKDGEQQRLDAALLQAIPASGDTEFIHSAAGVLIQLTRPSVHAREVIGSDPKVEAALETLCRHEARQLRQDGVKLLRALGKSCPVNQERFKALAQEAVSLVTNERDGDAVMAEDAS